MKSPSERGRIWVVEDSPLEAEMARRALSPTQEVLTFGDGAQVLERIAAGTVPDAIVLDWQLPGVSGLDVCRAVRAQYAATTLPILMLTVQDNKQDVVEAIAAGANDYVTKPYDVTELIARVATLVRTAHLAATQNRRARQLALAADVGAALTAARTLTNVAERCCAAILKHLDAAGAEVWRAKGDELTVIGDMKPLVPLDVVNQVVRTRKSLTVHDLASTPVPGLGPGLRALAVLPLVVGDDVMGALAISSEHSIEDALATLATIADLVALGVARVLSEEERAAILLRERHTRGEAEAANRSKDEFLAMVSHELRTPLNAITGWTSMLLGGGLDAARTKRALETIDRNARAQVQLIDDLLDISRIVSGKLRLNLSTIEIASIAEVALESIRLVAETKGVTLDARIDEHAGTSQGDAERIQQVIWNLLSNAIKFTPAGGKVMLEVQRSDGHLIITVTDSGQGISAEFLPRVFDRFKQADGTSTRAKGGLGLGLAIVRHIVEIHGGTIRAESEGPGKGARFVVDLPLDVQNRKHTTDSIGALDLRLPLDRPRELEGLHVLIVDDEDDARDLLRTLLESCKIRVTSAPSAKDGFEALEKEHFDVVVSDIAMPDEDGLSFIKRVRALPRETNGRVPAVALTAYARLEDRTRALRAGFNTHVAKPVEPNELLAVLSSLATSR